MERPEIAGWEVITNEKGIVLAIVNRDKLIETLKYVEHLEKQVNELQSNASPSSEVEKSFKHHELDIPFVQSQGGIPQDNENEGD